MIGQTGVHTLDLSRNHFVSPFRDLVVIGSWIFNEDQEDTEPCLVILPRHRPPHSVKPAVIALSAVHKYNDETYCVAAARVFNRDLGFSDDMANTHKVAEAIAMHLMDLIKMPENPTTAIVVADATVTIGGKTRTLELLDHQSTEQL